MSAEAHLAQGFVPLVRNRADITGVLFVLKDAPYRTVADLAGQRVAFVGQRSFCAVITRDLLSEEPGDLAFLEENVGSTRNVMKSVVLGKAAAGASLDYSMAAESADLVAELRVLSTTRRMASHPLSAHPRVPEATRARLAGAVLEMAAAPADRALLKFVRLADPVLADYDRDYKALEAGLAVR
jgi:phosphonate transport system substrate-binding protein